MADVTTRTLSNYLASLQATPSEDVTLVTQGLETWSTANLVTPSDLGSAAYQDVSYFALAASGVLANSAVQSVTGSGAVSVNNADPRNPIISIVGGGTGDVTGPASATSGRFASFNGTTGKLLQDSGFSSASFATAAQGTLAGTALQPAAIGTTVQGYSAVLAATTASFTTAKDTKLSGIATGATANNTDAFLLARANHTGTQAAATVTGLSTVATTGAYGDLSGLPTLGSLAAKNTVTAAVDFSATGTPSATTYLRGDNTWATPAGGGGGGGGQVNTIVAGTGISVNSTDPVNPTVLLSTASQNSLGKADTALQPAAIGVTVQGYTAALQSWGGITRAAGFDTFVATPTSANLAALVTNETGTGALVFGTSPTLVTPALGTPASGVLTNATGLPIINGTTGTLTVARGGTGVATLTGIVKAAGTANFATAVAGTDYLAPGGALGTPSSGTATNITGLPIASGVSGLGTGVAAFLATPTSANLAVALTDETGTGANVFATSPTLVTPALGTPSAAVLTNATGLPLTTGVTGTLPVANGGTGVTAAGTAGNILVSNGTTFVSQAPTAAGLGIGQTWQNLTGSRALATNYQNTSGLPISISVRISHTTTSSAAEFQVSPDNFSTVIVVARTQFAVASINTMTAVIPDGWYYKAASSGGTPTLSGWAELRV